MRIIKDNAKIKYLYHYTKKDNVDSILQSKQIKSTDDYVFFTNSYEKSVELFEQEMMSDHYYIDLDHRLKRRVPAKKEDYCIIKIPYKNDGKFVKFIFNQEDRNSIYSKSIIHKGTLFFEKATPIKIKQEYNKKDYFKYINKTKQKIMFSSFILSLFIPMRVYASTWLDEGNYNISWYTNGCANGSNCYLSNSNDYAGYAYIANKTNFNMHCDMYTNQQPLIVPNNTVIDLSDKDWVPISRSTCACICGIHRVILKSGQRIGSISPCVGRGENYISVSYKCSIAVEEKQGGVTSIDKTEAITGEKITITAIPNNGYTLSGIKINGERLNLSKFSNEGENKYGYVVKNNNITVEPVYSKVSYYPIYNAGIGVTINGNSIYYYDNEYSIPVSVHPAYRITSIKVNGEEVELENGYINGTITGPLTIDVETTKVGYQRIEDESNSIVIDFSKIKNSLELSYIQLEAVSFLANNNIIMSKNEYVESEVCGKIGPCGYKYAILGYTDLENKNIIDVDENYIFYQRPLEEISPVFPIEEEFSVKEAAIELVPIIDPKPISTFNFNFFTASEGTTSEDNIYYPLTAADKEIRNFQGDLIFEKYDSIIIKFGEYNVNTNNKKELVIDYSTTDNFYKSSPLFTEYIIDKGIIHEEYDETENIIRLTNDEGKVLAITDPYYYLLELGEGVTEEDNIEIEIDDDFTEAFPNIASVYNKMSLKFASGNHPKKDNNIIANLVNPKTGRNIIFSVIFIILLTFTTIYYKKKNRV